MGDNQPQTSEKIQSPSPQTGVQDNKKQEFNRDTKLPYNKDRDNKGNAESDGK